MNKIYEFGSLILGNETKNYKKCKLILFKYVSIFPYVKQFN